MRNAASPNGHAIEISPDGTRAYVAHDGSENVSVVDTATNSEIPSSPIELRNASRPLDIAITPDGTRAYVAGEFGRISVIDTATNAEVAGSPIVLPTLEGKNPRPTAIAISPDGRRAYVADTASELIFVIDTQTNAVIGSPIDLEPGSGSGLLLTAIAISPDGKRAYVTGSGNGDDKVVVIDTQANAVAGQPITAGILKPSAIAISPDGTRAYVANQGAADPRANTVAVIDTQTNRLLTSIPVGKMPAALAITPDGTRVYVANQDDHDVSAIDTRTDQPLPGTPIDLGAGFRPAGLAIAPDQGPVASFSVPATIRFGAPIHPDVSASRDPDSTVSAFSWDFGDGTKVSGQSPQHAYTAPGTYSITLATADNEGCSAGQIFTGHTVSCQGSAAAKASRTVNVVLPAVRVFCPDKAKRRGCQVKLRVVTKKRRGKAETKLARTRLRAGKSKLLSLHPRRSFITALGTAKRALVKETVKIGRLRHTTVRRLAIR